MLEAHAYCGYRSYAGAWAQDEYDTLALVRAAKGEPMGNSYVWRTLRAGGTLQVNANLRANAFRIFGDWARGRADSLNATFDYVAPIPAKSCRAFEQDVKGLSLARAAAGQMNGAKPLTVAYWTTDLPKASKGGSRDPNFLYQHLAFRGDLPPGRVLLVDDVITTGGHAKAVAQGLREQGHDVSLVFGLARTLHDRPASGMFAIEPLDLEGWF